MSDIPSELKYLDTHEWVRVEEGGLVRVGVTDHAQSQLGDVVYVELPDVDSHVESGESIAVIESVKSASDINAPLAGEIVEVNEALDDSPELVNQDVYGEGWLFVMKPDDESELSELLDAEAYEEVVDSE